MTAASAPGDFNAERILATTFVRRVEIHDQLGSTNDYALQQAERFAVDGPWLVVADRQTSGRGRGENVWWSADGALTFSLALDAAARGIAVTVRSRLALLAGVAMCEAIQAAHRLCRPALKWPNDVFLAGRKVCGILVEASPHPADLVVVGVGLNVNNSHTAAPDELRSRVIALCDTAQRTFDRQPLLEAFLQHYAELLPRIAGEGLSDLFRRWCLLEGRTVQVALGQRQLTGRCHGINDDGALLIETPHGLETCFAGVVSRIL